MKHSKLAIVVAMLVVFQISSPQIAAQTNPDQKFLWTFDTKG